MKTLIFFFLLITSSVFGQNIISKLVNEGVELNDQGKYSMALAKYREALEIDNNSTLALYEMGYTYMEIKNYKEAIKLSKRIISINKENVEIAYVMLGNAFDLQGNTKKSINTYKAAIKKYPNNNILYYNLAISYYNQGDITEAQNSVIKSVQINPKHGSSHLILSKIMANKGEKLKSMLGIYYFLMLEPNTERSKTEYKNLVSYMTKGIEKNDNKIHIKMNNSADTSFRSAELVVSLLAAATASTTKENTSPIESFSTYNKKLFAMLGEMKKQQTGLWWELYISTFADLAQTDNCEAFSYYISQADYQEKTKDWFEKNPAKAKNFFDWLEL